MPFNDLRRASPASNQRVRVAIEKVVDRGWYLLGPEASGLESELAAFVGVRHCVAVGTGTDALYLALAALGVGPGRTVVTAANAGGYTTAATRALGGTLIYADVDPDTLLLTEATIAAAVYGQKPAPAVLVVTHLFGHCAEMEAITAWASTVGIPVLEDCAQSMGARCHGTTCGSFGAAAVTSFYPTKNLGALGDGGAVFTDDSKLADHVRLLRQYGWREKYHAEVPGGINSRLAEIQAAVLRVRLPDLDRSNERRRDIHRRYEAALSSSSAGVRLVNRAGSDFVAHLAVLEAEDRAVVATRFADAGVQTDVHYPVPDHLQPIVRSRERRRLPVTELAAARVLSIPLFPELRDDEIDRVCAVLASL